MIYQNTILILLVGFISNLTAQDILNLSYYEDADGAIESKERDASYQGTTRVLDDQSISTEIRRIQDDKLVRSMVYKDGFPFGIWEYYDEVKDQSLFVYYPDEVLYAEELFEDEIYFDIGKAEKNEEEFDGFTAPRLRTSKSFYHCLFSHITYHKFARENGHEGTVLVHLKIHSDGQPEFICINRGYRRPP